MTRQDLFSALGAVSGVLTIVTAVLYYFGWRRSYVQAQRMNVDVSLFGFTSQDYVLRSISSLYLPLLIIFGGGLGWLWLHSRIAMAVRSNWLSDGERRKTTADWMLRTSIASGALAVASVGFTVAAGSRGPPPGVGWLALRLQNQQWVVPLVLLAATMVCAYSSWINRQLRPSRGIKTLPLWRNLLPLILISGTVVLGGFWLLEEYASSVGRGYAQQLADSVDQLPNTVLLSPTPLGLSVPGVGEDRLGTSGEPDVGRYRITGLRLLARSGGKVLLLHDGWSPASGTVIVVSDTDQLVWQFSR